MSVIEINSITKHYGNQKGVFDVSFSVNRGEVMGFLGPNGAGKTTTIRQLMGFIKPDKGKLTINGNDCFKNSADIQKSLGYLPGEISFMDDMSGMDFIKFIAKMKDMKDISRAKELMALFELDASSKIKKMSKGMKQKIGIVCAFMQEPEILILDEPTSGLDPLMQNRFLELISEEKKKGKTILMSSHMFEEIEKTCDKTVIIKDGRIVSVEAMEKLKTRKQKVFEIKFFDKKEAVLFLSRYPNSKNEYDTAEVNVTGDINDFIKSLSAFRIKDINIRTQTLEELFMHFYGGESNA